MPEFLGLEISRMRLALRIAYGVVLTSVVIFIFYYIPAHISYLIRLAETYFPAIHLSPSTMNLITGLFGPSLPTIGLVLGGLTFLGILLKSTKVEGGVLILNGLFYSLYTFFLFHGGTLNIGIPAGLVQGISGDFVIILPLIMFLLMLPELLTIAKGSVMLVEANRKVKLPQKESKKVPIEIPIQRS
jgi:hypothetical protein